MLALHHHPHPHHDARSGPGPEAHSFSPSATQLPAAPAVDPRPMPIQIPELLALILSALPPTSLSVSLLTVHSSFHTALLPSFWRSVKLGEVPSWRKFVRAVGAGSPGVALVQELDLRVTVDVLDRRLVDDLAQALEGGSFGRLRSLSILGSSKVARDLVDGPLFAQGVSGPVAKHLQSLSLDGAFPAPAVLALLTAPYSTSATGLRSLALQAATLAALPVGPICTTRSLSSLVVLPSMPYPSPSSMVHPRWIDHLLISDLALLEVWLDALAAQCGVATTVEMQRGPLEVDLAALVDLGGGKGGKAFAPLRERVDELRTLGVHLVGLPMPPVAQEAAA